MIEENKNIYVSYWLLLITFLVSLMIIIGGLTRLTESGLSITQWDLFTGIFPPITESKWEHFFALYKQIPEFKLLNSSMTLNEFKVIFWWEYIHRLLGRMIGLSFIIPLIFFIFKKMISKKMIVSFLLIFLLICFQGLIGWYMVKSGLTERTDVSHYRLATHLFIAFIIFILLFWNLLKINFKNKLPKYNKIPFNFSVIFLFLLLIQITIGAFVSGLDAGKIYQTWPLMGENYFPDDSLATDLFTFRMFENPSLIQFIHRNVAYIIILFFLYMLLIFFKNKNYSHLIKTALWILFLLVLQIFLGILTIFSGAQIIIASMHQIGSILLISTSLILIFRNSKIN